MYKRPRSVSLAVALASLWSAALTLLMPPAPAMAGDGGPSATPVGVTAPAPPVRFRGRVVDATTHAPVAGASLLVREIKRGAVSRRDGSFEIDGVPAGSYVLLVTAVGYNSVELHIVLAEDQERVVELLAKAVQLSEVTITAHHDEVGSARSVAVITPADLERRRGQTLGDALEDVPGISLLRTGPSITKPVVRGLHSQRVVVVNAGLQQEGQQWGAEHAPEIDPFAPATIHVLRGAAGVEYGAGAIGGVIRLQPRPLPESSGLGGELGLNGFSNNMQAAGALMLEGAPAWMPELGVRLQGSARKAGDARTPDYVIGNSGFEELNGAFTVGYHGSRFGADLHASRFGTQIGIFRGSHVRTLADLEQAIRLGRPEADYRFGYAIDAPRQEIEHTTISLAGHYVAHDLGRFEAMYGYQYNHRREYDAHNVRVVNDTGSLERQRASFELGLETNSAGLKLRHDPVAGLTGTVGVEGLMQRNVRGGTIKLIPNYRMAGASAFVIENYQLGDWIFDAGARFDFRRLRVSAITSRNIPDTVHEYSGFGGALGAMVQLSPEWSVAAGIGLAWRPPSVNELYSNDVHHGSAQFEIGSRDLATERSRSVDITLKHVGERSHAELGVYLNDIDGYIYLRPEPEPTVTIRGAYPVFRYRQTRARLAGFDGVVDYRVLEWLRLGAQATVVRGDNVTGSEPLLGMPADRFRLSAYCDLPGDTWLAAPYVEASVALVRRQDRYPAGVDYADPPPGYTVVDLALGAKVAAFGTRVHVAVSVANVFDTAHRDYLSRFRYFTDDPGRDIALRMTVPFGAVHAD